MTNGGISQQALASLFANRERFLAFVRKHINNPSDAEDILQSAFARTFEKEATIQDDESVVAWFYRVLRNAIIDHYRRTAARGRLSEQYATELKNLESSMILDPTTRNEICQCVWPMLNDLKPEYRDALKLVDIEEGPISALASAERISENNAAVRLHRARRALRKQVETACGACAQHGCIDCTCRTRS